MNTIEFTSSLISSLVWPATVFSLAIFFRNELRKLLARVTRLKHGESEAEFARHVEEAADRVEMMSGGSLNGLNTDEAKRIFSILNIDSRAALIAAWVEFEGTARVALYGSTSEEQPRTKPAPYVIEKLKEKGILKPEDVDFLRLVRQLRNIALHHHEAEIDSTTAYKAIAALLQLAWELKGK